MLCTLIGLLFYTIHKHSSRSQHISVLTFFFFFLRDFIFQAICVNYMHINVSTSLHHWTFIIYGDIGDASLSFRGSTSSCINSYISCINSYISCIKSYIFSAVAVDSLYSSIKPNASLCSRPSVFGEINVLNPHDTRQYLYCLKPKSPPEKGDGRTPPPNTIGKLDIVWRTNMGDRGRLQTSQFVRNVSGYNYWCLPRTTISQDVQTWFPVQLAFAKFLSKIKEISEGVLYPWYWHCINKCKPPLATPRGKLRLHVKLIQAKEQK